MIGFAGGMHCILMCTPVMIALQPSRSIRAQTGYQIGRILIYIFLGMLAGILGNGLSLFGIQRVLSVTMGMLIILLTVVPKARMPFYRLLLLNPFSVNLRRRLTGTGRPRAVTAGMINGLLPCGLVYVALSASLALSSPLQSMVLMAGFGMGTLPWLIFGSSLSQFVHSVFRERAARIMPAIAMSIGILFILRGLALDLPFISPALHALGLPEAMTICR